MTANAETPFEQIKRLLPFLSADEFRMLPAACTEVIYADPKLRDAMMLDAALNHERRCEEHSRAQEEKTT